jgi:uncharacterized protein (TIGR02246 family)
MRPPHLPRGVALGAAAALLAACASRSPAGDPPATAATAATAAADSAAIHELSRQFSAAYVRGDAAAMGALYTPDAVIFPDRSEMIAGREAIERYWTLRPGSRVTLHRATPTSIRVEGDLAYDYGVYEIAGTDGERAWGPSHGKYVIVWRRDAGGPWRIHLDIWNGRPQR